MKKIILFSVFCCFYVFSFSQDLQMKPIPFWDSRKDVATDPYGSAEKVIIDLYHATGTSIPNGTVIPVSYQVNDGAIVTENYTLTSVMYADNTMRYTFTTTVDFSAAGKYKVTFSHGFSDINNSNNSFTINFVNFDGSIPVNLPFYEDFSRVKEGKLDYSMYNYYSQEVDPIAGAEYFSFKPDGDYGFLNLNHSYAENFGAYYSKGDSKAIHMYTGEKSQSVILMMNLSNYVGKTVLMDFSFMTADKNKFGGDSIWIRGNKNNAWLLLYDYKANAEKIFRFQEVKNFNISQVLTNGGQVFSATTQIKFGQGGKTYNSDVAFDNIRLKEQYSKDITIEELNIADNPKVWANTDKLNVKITNTGKSTYNSGEELNVGIEYLDKSGNAATLSSKIVLASNLAPLQTATIAPITNITDLDQYDTLKITKLWVATADDYLLNDTIKNITLYNAMSGFYALNSSGSGTEKKVFKNLTELSYNLMKRGVASPVDINVYEGNYTEQLYLGEIKGAFATNYIKIKGIGDRENIKFVYSSKNSYDKNANIVLDGTKYLTLENLNIISEKASIGTCIGIQLKNFAEYNTVKKCKITINNFTIDDRTAGISMTARPPYYYYDVYDIHGLPYFNGYVGSPYNNVSNITNNNVIDENEIHNATAAVILQGTPVYMEKNYYSTNNKITNNKIINCYQIGVCSYYSDNTLIENNVISGNRDVLNDNSDFVIFDPIKRYSLTFNGGILNLFSKSTNVLKNKIDVARCPIFLSCENEYGGSQSNLINNVFISRAKFINPTTGVVVDSSASKNVNIYHNSICINSYGPNALLSDPAPTFKTSGNGAIFLSGQGHNVKNNSISALKGYTFNGAGSLVPFMSGQCIRLAYSTSAAIDYNDYFYQLPNGSPQESGIFKAEYSTYSTFYKNLYQWKAAFPSFDINSYLEQGNNSPNGNDKAVMMAGNTNYKDSINLEPCKNSRLIGKGTPVGVTTDIYGNSRNATNPTIGAFENVYTSIKDIFNDKTTANVNIYPNPSSDFIYFNVDSKKDIYSIEILNNLGQSVYQNKNKLTKVNISNLKQGIYILKLNYKNKILTGKFSKI